MDQNSLVPKNTNTKKPEFSLNDVIKTEYIKCAKDVRYFINKYCFIVHPQKGKIPFDTYEYQDYVLKEAQDKGRVIVLKSRQLGLSTVLAAYVLWKMIFNENYNVLVLATKQKVAINFVTKIKYMHSNLPSWLKTAFVKNNEQSISFQNGSKIAAETTASDAGRSEACSLVIVDEAAFIRNMEEIWTALQPTLSTGGDLIAISTPNGYGNWFHRTWTDSKAGKNNYKCIKLPWQVHPDRDQKWRDTQTIELGPRQAAQECLGADQIVTIMENGVIIEIKLKDLYNLNGNIKILTPTGYQNFSGMQIIKKPRFLRIHLDSNKTIDCSENHIFIKEGKEIFAKELNPGDYIDSVNDKKNINSIELINEEIELYDIIGVENGNLFIVDDIISHNCDAAFNSSGDSVVDPIYIDESEKNVIEPIRKERYDKSVWIFKDPEPDTNYIISADVARGDGADFSTFHVINIANWEQVAEYEGKIPPDDFGLVLLEYAIRYNMAYVIVENTGGLGFMTAQKLIDNNYRNLHYTTEAMRRQFFNDKTPNYSNIKKNDVPGFTTSDKTRPFIINGLEKAFRLNNIIVHSIRTIDQIRTFVYINNKAQAASGYNDDLVMALGIGIWGIEVAHTYNTRQKDATIANLNNIQVIRPDIQKNPSQGGTIPFNPIFNSNPYVIKTGNSGDIDLREFL